MLTFKEDTHEYFWNGAPVPGVSRVIDSCAPVLDTGAPAYMVDRFHQASDRGRAAHKISELLDKGEIDKYEIDPQTIPYMQAWRKFRKDFPTFKKPTLLDIKSGAIYWQAWIQLAAYENLLREKRWVVDVPEVIEGRFYSQRMAYAGTVDRAYKPSAAQYDRFIVQLKPDSPRKYRIHEPKHTFNHDMNVFVSMLNVYREKEANNAL